MNKQPLDLNRLRVFRAVWEQRNVSRAAESLGVSQPTVSHALRDLRLHYKDRIFVRCPGGVMPTPLGETLARRIGQALAMLEQGLDLRGEFDAAVSRREFTIVMTDIAEAIILPRIVDLCRRVPHFLALPTIVASSDMIATIPRPLAELMLPVASVRVFPVPIRLPRLLIEQFWHERYHDDAASRWLRGLLPQAMQQVFATGPQGFKQATQ